MKDKELLALIEEQGITSSNDDFEMFEENEFEEEIIYETE